MSLLPLLPKIQIVRKGKYEFKILDNIGDKLLDSVEVINDAILNIVSLKLSDVHIVAAFKCKIHQNK